MEIDYKPPPYSGPQVDQTGVNYPGQQAVYPPQAGPQAAPYQPPPYGFGDPAITVQPTIIPVGTYAVAQVAVVSLGDIPARITCPHCMTDVLTETEHINGLLTWLICGGLAIFACWLCCCIPFCVDACKDVKHTCPNCKNIIRIYKRM